MFKIWVLQFIISGTTFSPYDVHLMATDTKKECEAITALKISTIGGGWGAEIVNPCELYISKTATTRRGTMNEYVEKGFLIQIKNMKIKSKGRGI